MPALIALALVSSACASRDTQGTTAGSKVTELTSVTELRDRFDQYAGKVRLILLMSPT